MLITATISKTFAAPTTSAPQARKQPATTEITETSTKAAIAKKSTLITNKAALSNLTGIQSLLMHHKPIGSYTSRLRKRHSKRDSNWYKLSNEEEWLNPCGGSFNPNASGLRFKRRNKKEVYRMLEEAADKEYNTLKGSQQDIDINNINIWFLYNDTYKFLPKLKMNSSIALKRWYRNMQTFVGSLAYLRRVQLKWDHSKSQYESPTSRELKKLLISSLNMLCELEFAVNDTRSYNSHGNGLQQHITREQMNKRLKLHTKRRLENQPNEVHEADSIDLQFVKYYFYEFLHTMWKVLSKSTRRKGQFALQDNRKEFNEIEKQTTGIRKAQNKGKNKGKNNKRKNKNKRRNQNKRTKKQKRLGMTSTVSTVSNATNRTIIETQQL
ncbi:uncharacterized protein LOC119667036 [Teleopsis dalmanni]|uniref:uncharacterized protein LOC119667036 n=1 Tax=Teleopsis dalmanni TaxID=139649 RepID=UPI0018CE4516|nr:uncharacterized protein LOC119667036 [Teleopsis dalmanni]